MRYRALGPTGDYQFGTGSPFLVNNTLAVAQAIKTRLQLMAGEWFLDQREGLDLGKILGYRTQGTRDFEVKHRILGTKGVLDLLSYSSQVEGRRFTVTATVKTLYGQISITENL